MRVQQELLVCTEVKESAGGIIRASGKGISIREELERKKKGGHKNHGGGAPGMGGCGEAELHQNTLIQRTWRLGTCGGR